MSDNRTWTTPAYLNIEPAVRPLTPSSQAAHATTWPRPSSLKITSDSQHFVYVDQKQNWTKWKTARISLSYSCLKLNKRNQHVIFFKKNHPYKRYILQNSVVTFMPLFTMVSLNVTAVSLGLFLNGESTHASHSTQESLDGGFPITQQIEVGSCLA